MDEPVHQSNGGIFNGSTKLVMLLLTFFGTISVAGVAWVGTTLVQLESKVSSIETKVDLMLSGRIRDQYDGRP